MGSSPDGKLQLIIAKVAEGFIDEILAASICIELWMETRAPSGAVVQNKAQTAAFMGMGGAGG